MTCTLPAPIVVSVSRAVWTWLAGALNEIGLVVCIACTEVEVGGVPALPLAVPSSRKLVDAVLNRVLSAPLEVPRYTL